MMYSDSQLQKAVLDELRWEPSVTAAHIGVTSTQGVITLSGYVSNYAEKHAAEVATRRVKGVIAIAEELEVRLPFDMTRTDAEIASAATDRLAWDVSVPQECTSVSVEKGWITLTGQVDWKYQKDAAEQDLRGLFGVVGVSNQITIKPSVDAFNLSDDITHALHRSWYFDPRLITVSATGGNVRLTGSVHSPHDRDVAAATAWAAPGVTSVQNEISIS